MHETYTRGGWVNNLPRAYGQMARDCGPLNWRTVKPRPAADDLFRAGLMAVTWPVALVAWPIIWSAGR